MCSNIPIAISLLYYVAICSHFLNKIGVWEKYFIVLNNIIGQNQSKSVLKQDYCMRLNNVSDNPLTMENQCVNNIKLKESQLTSYSLIHSYVYSLINTCCIGYFTAVNSINPAPPPVHTYHHFTSVSVEIPLYVCCIINNPTGNSSSIGKEPVPYNRRLYATSSLVSFAEQSINTLFTNVLQGHNTIVVVCFIFELEAHSTCSYTQ